MNLTSLTVCDRPDSFVTDDNGHTFLHFQYIEDTGTEIHRHTSPLCLDLCSAGLMPKLLVVLFLFHYYFLKYLLLKFSSICFNSPLFFGNLVCSYHCCVLDIMSFWKCLLFVKGPRFVHIAPWRVGQLNMRPPFGTGEIWTLLCTILLASNVTTC
ncbi:hypothetical protein ABFA07_006862 [Porites harrisoni]